MQQDNIAKSLQQFATFLMAHLNAIPQNQRSLNSKYIARSLCYN